MTVYQVDQGTTSSGVTLYSGDGYLVFGTALSTTVNSGGIEYVYSGGSTVNTIVNSGGLVETFSDTSVSFTTLNGGQLAANTAVSTTVNSGGLLGAYDASFTTVNNGGELNEELGFTATSTTVNSGGFIVVSSGGTIDFTTVSSGGYVIELPGGAETSTTVSAGGAIVTTGVVVNEPNSGITVYPSSASGIVVGAGGFEYVLTGGTAISTTVYSTLSTLGGNRAATQDVFSGGTTISTTVYDRARENVSSGGTASFTAVSGGGIVYLETGASAVSTTAGYDGLVFVNGGTASNTTLGGVDSEENVDGGGRTFDTIVNSGGFEQVEGGVAVSATVNSGGKIVAVLGGKTILTTVNSVGNGEGGGGEYVYSGSYAISTTVNSGGLVYVSNGGSAAGTTLNPGGTEVLVSGATAINTTVYSGGAIDVTYLHYVSGGSASVNTSGLLTVSVGGQIYTQQLSGDQASQTFQLSRDTYGGTLVTAESAPCYRSCTRILTDHGEIAVEDLRVGNLVRTVLGETTAPIIWIGQRDIDCTRHSRPKQVWPVRIAAGAFGPGRPHTELFLSPDHAVYVGEVLIPIRYLINGSTITQMPMNRVSYYHFELPQHDVVLAQGLPAESFLDLKDGSNYANRPGPVRLYPDYTARMWEAFGCARLIVTGLELRAARASVEHFARVPLVA